jgi:pimeloyl-ACP methyl ester carboxylesterase
MTDTMDRADATPRTGYAPVNGLRMSDEVHGDDRGADRTPVLLLNGAYMTTADFGPLLPGLAGGRTVVVTDLQGHGRTNDADRPITYEGLADDVAALLAHLGIPSVDAIGYSLGGAAVLQFALRHPDVVHSLTMISASYTSDGIQPELARLIPTITPELFAGSPFEAAYRAVAPDPDRFPILVEKLKTLDETSFAWPADDIRRIAVPSLVVVGDADAVPAEHAVELFRLLGGGAMGDLSGLSRARLAVLPATSHFVPPGHGILDRHAWLLPMLTDFLDGVDAG